MSTRRSFISSLFSSLLVLIPVPFVFRRARNMFPKNLQQEFSKDGIPPKINYFWTGVNDQFFELFVDNKTGDLVDGNEIRPFLDWTPQHPEIPRWARFNYHPLMTSNQFPRGYRQVITTYLDSELRPIEGTQTPAVGANFAPNNSLLYKGKVGESFQFKSDWS